MTDQVAIIPEQSSGSVFNSMQAFDNAQRMAVALAKSNIIPTAYQNNVPNVLVALELAHRMGESPLLIMQNVHVIHGKPSFASSYLIGRVNNLGRFTPLQFRYEKLGKKKVNNTEIEDMACVAYATNIKSGDEVVSPKFTIEIAVKEGWYTKNGSKWPNMPELMLSYRCASAFASLYAPEVKGGMPTREEVEDIEYVDMTTPSRRGVASNQGSIIDQLNSKVSPTVEVKEAETKPEASEAEDDGMI